MHRTLREARRVVQLPVVRRIERLHSTGHRHSGRWSAATGSPEFFDWSRLVASFSAAGRDDPRQRPSAYALAIPGANVSSRREFRASTPIIRPNSTSTGLAAFIPGESGYASPLGVPRPCSGPLQRLQPLAIGALRHLHQQRSARLRSQRD